ncbi:hypothetical protein BDP27DRAFT_1316384 [Rhodocollybia butyracea]|uniref:Uncharacterized protein n=1 Tax=Rhodocollybia butyracea TaxID=206335 RepID=A0A9P5Q6M4_9AGAR|nr:hypothetical protein BDP27DRAFT_1340288 [Rhodocollybia butyracea]KAF9075042.1 hypothetical protein BDP27DRAFT_1316384 [Rhodocollybia butyracea]
MICSVHNTWRPSPSAVFTETQSRHTHTTPVLPPLHVHDSLTLISNHQPFRPIL